MGPKGAGSNDRSLGERLLNVATCLPFFLVSNKFTRHARNPATRYFGSVFAVVGAVAGIYHASFGPARLLLRKFDYWGIAYSSLVLRRAVCGRLPAPAAAAASALLLFKPCAVSVTNFTAVELRCAVAALRSGSRALLAEWLRHATVGAAATTCFFLEESPLMQGAVMRPVQHAMWHCLAAAGIYTTGSFVATHEDIMTQKGAV